MNRFSSIARMAVPALAALVFTPAHSLESGDVASARSERASLREDRPDRGLRVLERKAAPSTATIWDLTLGAAYTDAEDGSHAVNAPFELVARWAGSPFKFRLSGDGPTRISGGGASASGMSDVTITGSYAYALTGAKLVFAGGATLPAHGDVGGKHVKPRASMTWAGDASPEIHLRLGVGVVRVGGDLGAGQSRIGKSLTATLGADVAWGPFNAAMLQFIRTQRSGAGGSSTLVGGLDLPLSDTTTISTSVARGLTRGAKDTTIEIDWAHTF